MYGCTICEHRKSVLNTEPEFDFRRRKPNTEEMQTYGLSNYCSFCQRVTFFVNLLDYEGPLRGPMAWNIIREAAEKQGKIPVQEPLAPPASRERAGQLRKESEESSSDPGIRQTTVQLNVESEESSSSSVSENLSDSRTTGLIHSILYSETDSGTSSSRQAADLKVLYRRPSNPHNKERRSSSRRISAPHVAPSGGLLLQRKMMEKRKQRKIEEKRRRLEQLNGIMRRIEAKTMKLRTEMVALEHKTQQLETGERKPRRQREAAGALAPNNTWWGRENLEKVFGKWSPERRDSKMEEGADILMRAIQENSGSPKQERHTDQRDQRTRKEPSGGKDPRATKEHRLHKDHRSRKDLKGVPDRSPKKVHIDECAVKDRRQTELKGPWSMQNLYVRSSAPAEMAEKDSPPTDSVRFRDNERLRSLLESPKAMPQTLRVCREPLLCPVCPECQHRCFVSDFNTHVQRDHANVMLERIRVGQTKTFHLDLRLTKKNQPVCHMIYFVKDMIIDPQGGHTHDLLPVLVMTARMNTADVQNTKESPLEDDEALQFLLVWLCSYKPSNYRVIGTICVEATCAEMADSLTVRTARAYDIRAIQDMNTLFHSPSTLVMPYNFVRRISKRGNHSLTVSVKIE
ncbi:uncharacterized protein LOC111067527 [Drosophila obscura]|uniref:uncharacterized protein LOC111067527 n=1 Tax=Drosophila obscura TaxID=7282 RepID=UPI001BB18EED|nr:uncharacterized protein LOC111067527 [Drosophila obscura]